MRWLWRGKLIYFEKPAGTPYDLALCDVNFRIQRHRRCWSSTASETYSDSGRWRIRDGFQQNAKVGSSWPTLKLYGVPLRSRCDSWTSCVYMSDSLNDVGQLHILFMLLSTVFLENWKLFQQILHVLGKKMSDPGLCTLNFIEFYSVLHEDVITWYHSASKTFELIYQQMLIRALHLYSNSTDSEVQSVSHFWDWLHRRVCAL